VSVVRSRWHGAVLLVGAALSSAGCVAAGVAASPLISALQLVTDRTVERSVPADLDLAWGASVDTLLRMGFRVDRVDRDSDPRVIEASANRLTVTTRLARMTGNMTRVTIRVEAGGLTADRETAETLAGQIQARVKTATPEQRAELEQAARALDTLRNEVQQLRSTLDRQRPAEAVPASSPARAVPPSPGFSVGTPGIVVPTSYGFETLQSAPAPAATAGDAGFRRVDPPTAVSRDIREILAAPLAPASTLTPVQGFTTPSTVR
jgi:hypothetical protein